MASSDTDASKDSVSLDEVQRYRGIAQEQGMNAILSMHQRAENPDSHADSTRDSIYDAIAEAKKQITEKDKIPFGGDVKDKAEKNTASNVSSGKQQGTEDSASKGAAATLGDAISGYAKTVKEAVVGTASSNNNGE